VSIFILLLFISGMFLVSKITEDLTKKETIIVAVSYYVGFPIIAGLISRLF
jgi:ACR3 family arsenite efflux pump ArsB